MRTASPLISVIVLNHDGRQWLSPCLGALLGQTEPDRELILVDNASRDGSVDLVREQFPGVRVVALDENLGFAAGNNAGARAASGRYLAFLNNDTVADASWLSELRRALESDLSAGLATSRIVYQHDPSILDSAGDGYLRAGGGFKRFHGQPVGRGLESGEVFGACGAAFMIRRELFETLGGFDEDFFMVYEDVDLSYRARLGGARCLYVASAIVLHAGSATLGQVSPRAVFLGQRNLEWVYFKNTPWPLLWRSLPSHLAYDIAAGAGYALQGQLLKFLAGKWAALAGLARMWRKRRAVQRDRVAAPADLWRLMEPRWIAVKRLEKQFDFQTRRSG